MSQPTRMIPIADLGIKHGPARPAPSAFAEPCLLCGRWLERPGDNVFVEMTTSGEIVWPGDGTGNSVPNSQGGFPVGPDCYRKLVAAAKRNEPTGGATPCTCKCGTCVTANGEPVCRSCVPHHLKKYPHPDKW